MSIIDKALEGNCRKIPVQLPQGKYAVRHGDVHTTQGGTYHAELRPDRAIAKRNTVHRPSDLVRVNTSARHPARTSS